MATPQLITISNYSTLLVESTQGRAGTPDGNIFFDNANDRIEVITAEELPNVDLGSGSTSNPLTNALGITDQALYAFERLRRRLNNTLRTYRPGMDGRYKQAGAFAFINGIKLAADANSTTDNDDRNKIRSSGWIEYAASNGGEADVDRIYHGVRSLNDIDAASQAYRQLAASASESDRQAAAPVDFYRAGPIDEAVQVFGSTSHGDTNAGNFDNTGSVLIVGVRPWGRKFGETTSVAAGLTSIEGFTAGYGVGDDVNAQNSYALADVFGVSQIAPWTGMAYTSFDTPQSRSGFTTADGNYDIIISNSGNGSLAEIEAFLDALMLQDTDQDAHGTNTYLPKRGAPLYTKDDQGRTVTKQGIHIDNVPTADRQKIVQTDNAGAAKVYPFNPSVRIAVSDAWVNDANAWGQVMYADGAGGLDFDTANAVIVDQVGGADAVFTSADALGSAGSYYVEFPYDYDGNTQAGLSAGQNKAVVGLFEGDGGAQAADPVFFTITRDTIVNASALAASETNL